MRNCEQLYSEWMKNATADADVLSELLLMKGNSEVINDSFYRELSFGTGGLRGVIGAGTNRMNIYTVAKASKGIADYVNNNFPDGKRRIAVSYDSRIKSELFARTAAEVFARNGIEVFIYNRLMPTPCLSFAVRELNCSAGVMITASHNPAKYNGYKVYGPDGCQITEKAADIISQCISDTDTFSVEKSNFNDALISGIIKYIPESVDTKFIECVKKESLLSDNDINRNIPIVYTPLNGTGLEPVMRVLKESGFNNVTLVQKQAVPDGNFPTCPYPNPEIKEAMALGLLCAKEHSAELLIATDPDCDRAGIAVRDNGGEYRLLSGNETGILLFDYICSQRLKNGTMPENPVAVKTIVTTDITEKIAANYGVKLINVLTGFKFIGEQIGILESRGTKKSYIFGFEESYGYLSGTYVRDKDAVNAALLICEMFAFYKAGGISLTEKLQELYRKYGYALNTLYSFELEGEKGALIIQQIMRLLRGNIAELAGIAVKEVLDYGTGIDGLPKSDVLKFILCDGSSVTVRPSGTEPKIKVYLSVCDTDENKLKTKEKLLALFMKETINTCCV